MIPYITAAWLRKRGACSDQIDLFKRAFPDGTPLTRAALLYAAEEGLRVTWLAPHVLTDRLLAEYRRKVAPLLEEYARKVDRLRAEYEGQHASPLLAEYARQEDLLGVEYERKVAPIMADLANSSPPEDRGSVLRD